MSDTMFITRKFIQANPHVLFIFGDNDQRQGYGGMAKQFRGEPNTIGIRTKKAPNMDADAFYTDDEYDDNVKKIADDITFILLNMETYTEIYIPEGIGEGLAKLQVNAPKTYQYLKQVLKHLQGE